MNPQPIQPRNECSENSSLEAMVSNLALEIIRTTAKTINRVVLIFKLLVTWWKEQNLRAAEIEHQKYQDRLKHQARDPYRGFGRFYY